MNISKKLITNVSAACLSCLVVQASAAPGAISKKPLFAASSRPANVLFVLDDSRSMYRQVVVREEVYNDVADTFGIRTFTDQSGSLDAEKEFYITHTPSKTSHSNKNLREALRLCFGVNYLAFNPNETYKPWTSTLFEGDAAYIDYIFEDTVFGTITSAPPNNVVENLAQHSYLEWQDDGDGIFQWGECGVFNPDRSLKTLDDGTPAYLSKLVTVGDSADDNLKSNYANWFTYHRDRFSVFRAALSDAVHQLDQRAALATINANAQLGWGREMAEMSDVAAKKSLLKAIFDIGTQYGNRDGHTPLRMALENAGLYFSIDPVSNTPANDAPSDNFVSTSAPNSPRIPAGVDGECQVNFAVLATDGLSNEGSDSPEGNYGTDNSMADIARYFRDEEGIEMRTHALSFGLKGTLSHLPQSIAPKDYPAEQIYTDEADIASLWPTNVTYKPEHESSLEDLVHAVYEGEGKYMSASTLEGLQKAFQEILDDISATVSGSGAAVSFNSSSISSDTSLFQGWFDTNTWSGDICASNYDGETLPEGKCGGVDIEVGAEIVEKTLADQCVALEDKKPGTEWNASFELCKQALTPGAVNGRKIITHNGISGIAFQAPVDHTNLKDTELSSEQLNDLLYDSPGGKEKEYLSDIISYLRGDSQPTEFTVPTAFRPRHSLLADIVHSSPQYVANPRANYPNFIEGSGDKAYFKFVTAQKGRTPMVYVGANGGMLHAFNANSGKEVFAYVPQAVFSSEDQEGLHYLARPSYTHLPYVDATPTVGDVYVNGSWHTYLVGGLGAGGKGVYVLDITNPASIGDETAMAGIVKQEFSDEYLGYTFSRPQIAKLNNGEWVAIFGNGYNNNTDGKGYLYVLYLDGEGNDFDGDSDKSFDKIAVGNGSVADGSCESETSDCNGLSSPTLLDLDGDGKLDRVYAGDVHGNMWAFDFTNQDGADLNPIVAHNNKPLFSACRSEPTSGTQLCAKAHRQPITVKPVVVSHDSQRGAATAPNLVVMFGTGQYLTELDKTDTAQQSLYAVWDAGKDHGNLYPDNLEVVTIANTGGENGALGTSLDGDAKSVTYNTTSEKYGWKASMIDSSERLVVSPIVAGDIVLFLTTIPSANECQPGGGGGHLIALGIYDGVIPFTVFPDKTDIAGFDIDALPGGMVVLDNDIILSDAKGRIADEQAFWKKPWPSRRSSWSIQK